jgi:hypothetical protein
MPAEGRSTLILQSELGEVRDELRRIDAKARDLLVVATLAVTVAGVALGLLRTAPPAAVTIGYLLATGLWMAAVVQLVLVVRPMLIPHLADPGGGIDGWLHRRWQALTQIVTAKYLRVRRAVDLLLAMTAVATLSTLIWVALAVLA